MAAKRSTAKAKRPKRSVAKKPSTFRTMAAALESMREGRPQVVLTIECVTYLGEDSEQEVDGALDLLRSHGSAEIVAVAALSKTDRRRIT